MKPKVNILCVYWVGDFRGRDFKPEDVHRLYKSVWKNIDRDFDFYVLTNDMEAPLPGIKIPLAHANDWPGWWAKMELYRPGILPPRRTLYMDLDSHAIRSLQPILDYEGDLVLFNTKDKKHQDKHLKRGIVGIVYRYQAATILYTPGEWTWLYEKFLRDWDYYLEHYRSDQDILGEWIPNQPRFPDSWLMKMGSVEKNPVFRKSKPPKVIIVTGQTRSGGFRKTYKIEWFEKAARGE
jgi:hypothetical protein